MVRGALSEKQIENQCLSWFKIKGIFAFKVKSVGTYDPTTKRFRAPSPWYRRGCPDILACYDGLFIGFEIKTKIGRLSEHQESFHEDLRRAGGQVFVIRDVSELDPILAALTATTSLAEPRPSGNTSTNQS